jgi:EmrB/QacA subfamily drug resistance transporter
MAITTDSTHQRDTGQRSVNTVATLVAVGLASLMVPLAVTGPAVALTRMATDLSASGASVQWVLNAYNVTFAATLLAAGGLADRLGRRRVLIVGTSIYALMSLLCALSTNILTIDIARAIQGIGSAGILTSGAAILAATFEGRERARAFGVLGTAFGAGLALGPVAAGVLVDVASWRAVFAVNVAFAVVVFALSPKLRESRNQGAPVDWPGLVTFSGGLFLLTLGFVEGQIAGWGSALTYGSFIGAALFIVAFVVVERRSSSPVFDLSLLRRPTFLAVMSQPFTIVFGFVILVVYLPSYFQGADGYSPGAAGLMLLPLMLPVLVLPLLIGQVANRVPPRIILTVSSLLIAAGSIWLTTLQPGQAWYQIGGPLLVFGLGVGSAFGVMDNAAVSSVPVKDAGMAAGMFNTVRITGESIATAGAAALLSGVIAARLLSAHVGLSDEQARSVAIQATQGRARQALGAFPGASGDGPLAAAQSGLTSAMHITVLVVAGLALIGAAVTFRAIRDKELGEPGES